MTARYYTVRVRSSVSTGVSDLWEFRPADEKPIEIVYGVMGQETDMGDAEEEVLRLQWIRGNTVSGSGGAAITPEELDPVSPAAGFACERFNTTPASGGTEHVLHTGLWNIRTPWIYYPEPEARPFANEGEFMVLRLAAAVADAITVSSTIYVKEH